MTQKPIYMMQRDTLVLKMTSIFTNPSIFIIKSWLKDGEPHVPKIKTNQILITNET